MQSLRLVSDRPEDRPRFGVKLLGKTLAEVLAEGHQDALVLGLHGPWGAGKSTLMKAIETALRQEVDPNAIFIDFNAWKYQDREALWRALILRILDRLREELNARPNDEKRTKTNKEIDELERSLFASFTAREQGALQVNWTSLVTEIVLTLMRLAAGGIVGGIIERIGKGLRGFFDSKDKGGGDKDVADSVDRAAKILHREVVERSVEQVKAIDQFLDRYKRLMENLGAEGKKVYVLIDDLDRCLPDEALTIFEAIKLFLDSPQCRYVVAIDRGMIRRGLELRYKDVPGAVDPDEYIEKTISLSFDLPLLQRAQAESLLLAAGLSTVASKEMPDPWHKVIVEVLGTNPRRLKRVANSLRVTRALAAYTGELSEADGKLLLKLGLIAYRNSAAFEVMRRDFKRGESLQQLANQTAPGPTYNKGARDIRSELPDTLKRLADDNGFWDLMRLSPDLDEARLRKGTAWFQPKDEEE